MLYYKGGGFSKEKKQSCSGLYQPLKYPGEGAGPTNLSEERGSGGGVIAKTFADQERSMESVVRQSTEELCLFGGLRGWFYQFEEGELHYNHGNGVPGTAVIIIPLEENR